MQETQEMQVPWIPGSLGPWVRKVPWKRKQLPTPVFLPGKSHGQRSLVDYSSWGHKESDVSQWLSTHSWFLLEGETMNCFKNDMESIILEMVHPPTHTHGCIFISLQEYRVHPLPTWCMTGYWGLGNYSSLTNNTAINHRKTKAHQQKLMRKAFQNYNII